MEAEKFEEKKEIINGKHEEYELVILLATIQRKIWKNYFKEITRNLLPKI